jgi:hypothetical protein
MESVESRAFNSKTIIGIGLILSGIWLFSDGVSNKFSSYNNKKSASNISRVIKDASNVHNIANSMNKNTIISRNIYE